MNWGDQGLNTTELVLLARNVDSSAHRGLPRELLLEMLETEESPGLPMRRLDKHRLQIMNHINTYWDQVSALVSCPAKSRDPHACFGCSDVQAACCTLDNAKQIGEQNAKDL